MPQKKSTIKKASSAAKTKKLSPKKKVLKKTLKPAASLKKPALVKKEKPVDAEKIDNQLSKRYYEAVGRRKTSTARVRLFTCRPFEGEEGRVMVNGKPYNLFFPTLELRQTAIDALKRMKSLNRFEATVVVRGGGIRGQAEAIRHGLARALVKFNLDFSKKLKRAGFLKRDPRKVERKKPGLRKARRAPQWRKR